jgi:hypothetical protein
LGLQADTPRLSGHVGFTLKLEQDNKDDDGLSLNAPHGQEQRDRRLNVEDFFKAYQFTIAALGVLGTFLAVVVALFSSVAALRISRTRISARVLINVVHHKALEGRERPRYVVVYISNLGTMPVHIPLGFFRWKLPFKGGIFAVVPHDYSAADEWVAQKKYPVEIRARGTEIFFLSSIDAFHDTAQQHFIGKSLWGRLRSRFLTAFVMTNDGKTFAAKIESSLRKELAQLRKQRRAVSG